VAVYLQLRHASGSLAGHIQRLTLEEGETLSLGRGADCDVKFHDAVDDAVSALHARLRLHLGRLVLEDQRSLNGTFVNGARCPAFEPVAVPEGARVRLAAGGPEFQVSIEESGGAAPPPAIGCTAFRSELASELTKESQTRRDPTRRRALQAGLLLVLLLAALGVALGLSWSRPLAGRESAPPPLPSWAEVEARVRPIVARVKSRFRLAPAPKRIAAGGEAFGSGVLVQPTLVLTSAHLARPWRDALVRTWDEGDEHLKPGAELDSLSVQLPGQEPVPATLFALSGDAGLALLQVPHRPTAPLGLASSTAPVEVAEEVAFLLHPTGAREGPRLFAQARLASSSEPSSSLPGPLFLTARLARIEAGPAGEAAWLTLDRSLAVAGGGAPVINRRGELVGIVRARFEPMDQVAISGQTVETRSYGFGIVEAVPIEKIRHFLTRVGVIPAQPPAVR
jgi:S1-C subfamily serine protease